MEKLRLSTIYKVNEKPVMELLLMFGLALVLIVSATSVAGLEDKFSSMASPSFSSLVLNAAHRGNKSAKIRVKREPKLWHSVISLPPKYHDGCGEAEACTSEATWEEENCPFILKWKFTPPSEYMHFELIGLKFKEPPISCPARSDGELLGYIAVGFSSHDAAKNNVVIIIECSVVNGTGGTPPSPLVKDVTFGWVSKEKKDYSRINETFNCIGNPDSRKIKDCDIKHVDNEDIKCSFTIKRRTIYRQTLFNFDDSDYFVNIISGCEISEIKDGIENAGVKCVSLEPIHFHNKRQGLYGIIRSWWAMVHGSLMTVVWCICIPNGLFFARYFKESYVLVPVFKYRPWFAIHTISSSLAFLLSVAAVIAMMHGRSELKLEWPKSFVTRIHYQLGFIALILLIGLVLTGWMRFAGRRARRVFAFIHFITGILCYMFSMMTLGHSNNLGMPCRITTYTIVIVLWSIVCHCAMMIHFYFLDKRLGLYIKRALYPFPLTPVTYDELPGSRIRLIIISVHFTGTILMSIVILVDYYVSDGCTCERDICK